VLYRIFRSVNSWFAVVLLWVYVLAFLMALPLMFVFPLAPLGMLAAGLFSLGVAALVSMWLHMGERAAARRKITGGVCPACGSQWPRFDPAQWPQQCSHFAREFAANGAEVEAVHSLPAHGANSG
jgi:hypothetical protein